MIKRGNAIDFSRLFGSIAFISFLSNNTGLVGKKWREETYRTTLYARKYPSLYLKTLESEKFGYLDY